MIEHFKGNGVSAVFHYLSLHRSEFYKGRHDGRELVNCDRFADCRVRLPLFCGLTLGEVGVVCGVAGEFFNR